MTDENNHEPISLGELRYRLHQRREAMRKKLEAKKNAIKAKFKNNKTKGTDNGKTAK